MFSDGQGVFGKPPVYAVKDSPVNLEHNSHRWTNYENTDT